MRSTLLAATLGTAALGLTLATTAGAATPTFRTATGKTQTVVATPYTVQAIHSTTTGTTTTSDPAVACTGGKVSGTASPGASTMTIVPTTFGTCKQQTTNTAATFRCGTITARPLPGTMTITGQMKSAIGQAPGLPAGVGCRVTVGGRTFDAPVQDPQELPGGQVWLNQSLFKPIVVDRVALPAPGERLTIVVYVGFPGITFA